MIGFIRGQLITKYPDQNIGVVMAGDVGYEIILMRQTFDTFPVNETVSLWIHTHVREDIFSLFGFATENERLFFRQLIAVSGLGPKTALSLLGEHGPDILCRLILNKDSSAIATASGVGKKLAEKLILELASKVEKWTWTTKLALPSNVTHTRILSPDRQMREDLSSALINLGYHPNQVSTILDKLCEREDIETLGFESGLKSALREMSKRPLTERNAGRPNG